MNRKRRDKMKKAGRRVGRRKDNLVLFAPKSSRPHDQLKPHQMTVIVKVGPAIIAMFPIGNMREAGVMHSNRGAIKAALLAALNEGYPRAVGEYVEPVYDDEG
jgi:hypothetical protein